MANWTAEKMTEELKALLGSQLVSVVLYGSAAGGDHAGKNSDINLLVVTHPLYPKELLGLSKAVDPLEGTGQSSTFILDAGTSQRFRNCLPG